MSLKPVTPEQLKDNLEQLFPEFVIQSINEIIKENYRGSGSFSVKQNVIADRIIANADKSYSRQDIIDKKWLDFEELYRANGWSVVYDKPGWDENYEANFKFKASKK